MNISIDWLAFAEVFVSALAGAMLVVALYAAGLRLLVRSGRVPLVAPAEFADAITVVREKDIRRAAKAAARAAKKSPLTAGQKRWALVGACTAFGMCGLAVVGAIALIVPNR